MRIEVALAIVIGAAGVLVAEAVSAQAPEPLPGRRRGDGYTYYEQRRTKGPEHGFEGFAGPAMRQRYCSYRRIPERECGPNGCRVKSWIVEQWCD